MILRMIPKLWGSETIIVNNGEYCGKYLDFNPRTAGSLHYHPKKHETFLLLDGVCELELEVKSDGSERTIRKTFMHPSFPVEIAPGEAHRIIAHTSVRLLEISTPHSDDDVVRIEPSKIFIHAIK